MAIVLTINGVDRTTYIENDTFDYEQIANDQVDSLDFTLRIPQSELATIKPSTKQEISVTVDGAKVFGGRIINIEEAEIDFKIYGVTCECRDFSHDLTGKLVIDTFSGATLIFILNSLLNTYANYVNKIIDPMETGWSGGSADTTNFVEGTQSVKISNEAINKAISLDLTLLNNGQTSTTSDYIEFWYFISGDINKLISIAIKFGDTPLTTYFRKEVGTGFKLGWNFFRFKKSTFIETGSPDWSTIAKVELEVEESAVAGFAKYGPHAQQGTYSTTFQYSADPGAGTVDVSFDDVRMTRERGIDKGFIQDTFGTVDFIAFNYIPLFQAIQELAELMGAYWYVDVDRGFHFGAAGFEAAPFSITDDNGNMAQRSLVLSDKGENLKNKIFVRGGEFLATALFEPIQHGDGEKRSFRVDFKTDAMTVTIDVGAGFISQDVGIDNEDVDDGSFDWFWNNNDKTITQADFGSPTTLSAANRFKESYFPFIPLIVVVPDQAAIAANDYQEEEFLILDKNITDKQGARERGLAELKAYAAELVDGSFSTYTTGLVAGQQININSILRGRNETFIIWAINATMHTKNDLRYNVKLISKRKLTLVNTLIRLLLEKTKTTDSPSNESVDDILPHLEDLIIEEVHTETRATAIAAKYGPHAEQGTYTTNFKYS